MKKVLNRWLIIGFMGMAFSSTVHAEEAHGPLSALDQAVQKFEGLALAEQRAQVGGLVQVVDTAADLKKTRAIKNNLVASFLLGDIQSVGAELKLANELSDTEFSELIGSLHPLVETLLEELKIPHVCNHAHHQKEASSPKKHDHHGSHGHEGHDH